MSSVANLEAARNTMGFFRGTVAAGFAIAGLLTAGPASAALITAQNGFGTIGSSFGSCKSVSKSAAFATGEIVSGSDWTLGCVGYYSVAVDTGAKTITLTGLQVGNYESAFLDISGIVGETITGLSMSGPNNLFDPNAYGGAFATAVPTPSLSFTGSSLRIEWTAIGNVPPAEQFAFSGNGTTVFSYASVASVPEPGTLALLVAGLGMIGLAIRRRPEPQPGVRDGA